MAKVAARFYVSGLEKKPDGTAVVRLHAVTSKENARWSQYTPDGQIEMNLTRKASGARTVFEQVIDRSIHEQEYQPECLVTLDFDAPPAEQPEYRSKGADDELGYISDEVPLA